MRIELQMKYCETIYQRYHEASKESKTRIFNELCKVCGYNRKYAIARLTSMRDKRKPQVHQKRKRKKLYSHEVLSIVEDVWKTANYPWSVRLKEILRLWMPWIKRRYRITP